jgi:hypothetical protein
MLRFSNSEHSKIQPQPIHPNPELPTISNIHESGIPRTPKSQTPQSPELNIPTCDRKASNPTSQNTTPESQTPKAQLERITKSEKSKPQLPKSRISTPDPLVSLTPGKAVCGHRDDAEDLQQNETAGAVFSARSPTHAMHSTNTPSYPNPTKGKRRCRVTACGGAFRNTTRYIMGTIDGKLQHIVRIAGKQYSNYVDVATQIADKIRAEALTKDTWNQTHRHNGTDKSDTTQRAQTQHRQHTDNMHTTHNTHPPAPGRSHCLERLAGQERVIHGPP